MKVKSLLIFFGVIVAIFALVGINTLAQKNNPETEAAHEESEAEQSQPAQQTPAKQPTQKGTATFECSKIAVVKTNRGTFKFALYEKDMPISCSNFISLANKGFYNKLTFHRVEDFVVQGGDPEGTGNGGSSKCIPLETKAGLGFDIPYMVGMARTANPNSATSQYFIIKKAAPQLTNDYAAFGQVFEGQDVIDKMEVKDIMESVTIASPSSDDLNKIKHLH